MNDRPILVFPQPVEIAKHVRRGSPISNTINYPEQNRQISRINPKLRQLEESVTNGRGTITTDITGINPEYAIVFETIGTMDNFVNAVKKINGLEWLAEIDGFLEPDSDFFITSEDGDVIDKQLKSRLFLVMTNQTSIRQLKNLWNKYKNNEKFEYGTGKWKELFSHLKDLRLWSITDRISDTGLLETLSHYNEMGMEKIKFEIELWHRESLDKRNEASRKVKNLVREANGRVLSESIINDISYHAILVEAPISIFEDLSEDTDIQLIKADSIMYFRPVGQALTVLPVSEDVQIIDVSMSNNLNEEKPPIVALFDGLPMQNHDFLRGRLIIDDPDNFENDYPSNKRIHGTTMASLIINGELDGQESPLDRKIYVRPIMKPNPSDFINNSEFIPDDILLVDLIHRAVRRLFEGDGDTAPVAPEIKIINLSIGDLSRPFDLQLSPWAKLLDYLSFKYKVLFIVSTGNYSASIELEDVPKADFVNIKNTPILEEKIVKHIANSVIDRRLLSPAESMNSLSIGASYKDMSLVHHHMPDRIDIFPSLERMSPYSRIGMGYKNSIKPDILLSGGRQFFRENIVGRNGNTLLDPEYFAISPGHKVCYPSEVGNTNEVKYTRGTSNAAALASRLGAKIYEVIEELVVNNVANSEYVIKVFGALFVKNLLVHGAHWNSAYEYYKNILMVPRDTTFKDNKLPRLIGYGFVDESKIFNSSEQKVTLIGYGEIRKDGGQLFEVPLPPSLSGRIIKRRLTITLSWFTPISNTNMKYRKAQLWFDSQDDVLNTTRLEVSAKAVTRGTVQHGIFEGERASAFIDGDVLRIRVNCAEDSNGLGKHTDIPYTIAVTLEVAQGTDIPIYTEVRDRLRLEVRSRIQ